MQSRHIVSTVFITCFTIFRIAYGTPYLIENVDDASTTLLQPSKRQWLLDVLSRGRREIKRSGDSECLVSDVSVSAMAIHYGAWSLNLNDQVELDDEITIPLGGFVPIDMPEEYERISLGLLRRTAKTNRATALMLTGASTECTHADTKATMAPLQDKAMCPYYWTVNYDPLRYDFYIQDAYVLYICMLQYSRCNTRSTLSLHTGNIGATAFNNMSTNCHTNACATCTRCNCVQRCQRVCCCFFNL
jgi:hypothetical protein